MTLSKILLPVAFSERCRGAARYAAAPACHFHSELTLLHVVVPSEYLLGGNVYGIIRDAPCPVVSV